MSKATPSQQSAIDCDEHLILFAGPGSGKTSTSISKAVRILQDPDRRLILCTFTKEAAGELNLRLQRRFSDNGATFPGQRVLIGTLDSLALQHLQSTRGKKRINLLPPPGQSALLRQIVFEKGLPDLKELSPWLEKYQGSLDRDAITAQIRQDCPEALILINMYLESLRAGQYVDLSTVKRTCALGMAEGKIPPFKVSNLPCTDFLIDEVQDSDELQLLFADAMASAGTITTLVGDDDQTIYVWRGACGYKGMTNFATKHNSRIVRLGENFRSHSEVVSAATKLIAYNNPDRVDKEQVSMKGPGGSVACLAREGIGKQAAWVAGDILGQIDDSSVLDCAILVRVNIFLDTVEEELTKAGIPYFRSSGSIWDTREATIYFGLLRYITSYAQDGLLVLLQGLRFSLEAINYLVTAIIEHPAEFARGDISFAEDIDPEGRDLLVKLGKACGRWRKDLAQGWITNVIDDTAEGLLSWGAVGNPATKSPKAGERMRNIVMASAKVLNEMNDDMKLSVRLQKLLDQKGKQPKPGDVRLMTMHASKGLEFDMVYLIGCSDDETTESVSMSADARRVMYVAMTRAARYLRVLYDGKTPRFMKEAGLTPLTAT